MQEQKHAEENAGSESTRNPKTGNCWCDNYKVVRETYRKAEFRPPKLTKANNERDNQANREMSQTAAYHPNLLIASGMKHEFLTAKSRYAPASAANEVIG